MKKEETVEEVGNDDEAFIDVVSGDSWQQTKPFSVLR
jgi:hypothetical protein